VSRAAKQSYTERGSVSRRSEPAATQIFKNAKLLYTKGFSVSRRVDSVVNQSANKSEAELNREGFCVQKN
jgi:hypothetical protein